jgi:hypothetical protein
MQQPLFVRGKVTTQQDREPVHGLHVRARTDRAGKAPALAAAITRADGTFELHWASGDPPRSVELVITDREGQIVATRRAYPQAAAGRSTRRSTFRLDDADLADHRARPATWRDEGARILPAPFAPEVRQAISMLAPVGSEEFDRLLGHVLCPGPMLPAFDDLIRLGWEVLERDPRVQPGALERFRDTIQTLEVAEARHSRLAMRDGADAWERLVSDDGVRRLRALGRGAAGPMPPNALAAGRTLNDPRRNAPRTLASGHAAFGADVLVPLLLPASQAAAGRPQTFARYVALVVRQLDTARHLRTLHGAARRALTNDPDQLRHFAGMLDLFGLLCGPDDGPQLVLDEDFRPIDEIVDPHCLADLIDHGLHDITLYVIDEVIPLRACPGETVTINGYGFDSVPELVRFARREAVNQWIDVEPQSWSNEQITVVVPEQAGCGLRLALAPKVRQACGRYVDAWPTATGEVAFEGGAAQILNFAVNDGTDTTNVLPGGTLEVTWRTCAADDVHLEIIRVEDGSVEYELTGAAAEGVWTVELFQCNSTTELRVRLTATGSCAPLQVVRELSVFIHELPALSVHGIEVTQGIQYYRSAEHLTDEDDIEDDNHMQLVAGKTAYVRVYLRSGLEDEAFDDGILNGVEGWIDLQRIEDGTAVPISTLTSVNGPIDARWGFEEYADERGDVDASLNFLIPAQEMRGRLRFDVRVEVLDTGQTPCGGGTAEASLEVDVDLDQTLNIVAIPVAYDGPDFDDPTSNATVTIAAPTEEQFLNRLGWTLRAFPVNEDPQVRTTSGLTIDFTLDGDRTGDGGCSQAWYNFLAFNMLPARISDGNEPNAVYLGLIPDDLPMNPSGCATLGVTGLNVTKRRTIAHEIAHILGRPHAPRGDVGFFDPQYPAYEPYDDADVPNGSLGEYGFDVGNEKIYPPGGADLMSYGSNRWMSLYNYSKLIAPGGEGGWLTPTPVPAGDGGGGSGGGGGDRDEQPCDPEPCIVLTALIDADGNVEVGHVSRVTTRRRLVGNRSPFDIEHLNEDGKVLAASALYTLEPVAGSCACASTERRHSPAPCARCQGPSTAGVGDGARHGEGAEGSQRDGRLLTALALLPDRAPGALLRIRRGERSVWERKAPSRQPSLRLREAQISSRGRLSLRWEAKAYGDERPILTVRWSPNRRDWRLLAPRLSGSRATLDVSALPAGKIYLELLLHDGFHTARAVSSALEVPASMPRVAILHPDDEEPVRAGGRLRLWALVRDSGGTRVPDDDVSWHLDGQRVGEGHSLWVRAPRAGRHTVACTVSVGRRRTTRSVDFVTR